MSARSAAGIGERIRDYAISCTMTDQVPSLLDAAEASLRPEPGQSRAGEAAGTRLCTLSAGFRLLIQRHDALRIHSQVGLSLRTRRMRRHELGRFAASQRAHFLP
jgi:hypothetical protein